MGRKYKENDKIPTYPSPPQYCLRWIVVLLHEKKYCDVILTNYPQNDCKY